MLDEWRPLGGSNPCYRRERAVSWTTRRRGREELLRSLKRDAIVPKRTCDASFAAAAFGTKSAYVRAAVRNQNSHGLSI